MTHSITSKEIKKYILELEQKYPVNHWRIDGVYIWPHIRIKIFIFLLNHNADRNKLNPAFNSRNCKRSILERLLKAPAATANALTVLCQFFIKLKPKKILFFGSHFHRTRQNGVFFNRFFDSMIDTHKLQDEVYMVEFEKVYEKNYNQKAILPLHKYLDQFKLLKKLERLFVPLEKVSMELNGYETFYEELIREFPEALNLNISIEALRRWAQKINRTKGFFTRLYEKTKPEKIIFLSYYGYDDLAAAILAAHELGIKTIDFQHGPQTNVHMAYSNWTKLPKNSFNTMPSEYWCWDQKTKENIDCWAGAHDEISSKVAGHPYLGFWANKIPENRNNESYILYSLQLMDLEEMFPKNLVSVIKNSKQKWVFRLHPRSGLGKNEIKEILDFHKIEPGKFSIEDSYSVPLPQTILQAMVHITNFSGCVIESSMMSVPSIIIDEYGKEIYKSYLDDQSVFFINKKEADFENNFFELLDNLKKRTSNDVNQKIINPLTF